MKTASKQTAFRIFIPSWWMTSFYVMGTATAVVTAWLIIRSVKRREGRGTREEE